jgi:predicted Rossmann-fold nucleotide-binding protein
MKYKIGIFGSSGGDMNLIKPKVTELGNTLGNYANSIVIVTGAGAGMPYDIASIAASHGVEVIGYSDSFDLEDHKRNYPDHNLEIYSQLVYVPPSFLGLSFRARKKLRNVISTGDCDSCVIVSGRWGTLNEFTNMIDQQKLVGVLTGTDGIADMLPELSRKISKEGQGEIIFDNNPNKLIEKVLTTLKTA